MEPGSLRRVLLDGELFWLRLRVIWNLAEYFSACRYSSTTRFGDYSAMLKGFTGFQPLLRSYARWKMQLCFAFSTASSNATIPNNGNCEEPYGCRQQKVSLSTVPLGDRNMDGTAIMQQAKGLRLSHKPTTSTLLWVIT
ncbi:dicarboxylate/amino acid:cation symporter [Vibrio chagasii]|nr:dicarboxylate/amino acid:cation symporter [Vibrio chagasii]